MDKILHDPKGLVYSLWVMQDYVHEPDENRNAAILVLVKQAPCLHPASVNPKPSEALAPIREFPKIGAPSLVP